MTNANTLAIYLTRELVRVKAALQAAESRLIDSGECRECIRLDVLCFECRPIAHRREQDNE